MIEKLMIDITKSGFLKYFLFASLYFTEGLEYIIASLILPIYLIDKGIAISIVTIVSAIYLIPMTIKFIWVVLLIILLDMVEKNLLF